MGQKTNPIGFRIGYTKKWESLWYAKNNYAEHLKHDYLLREFIYKKVRAKISRLEILRAYNKLTINLYCDKPGLVIGRKGSEIAKIKNDLCKKYDFLGNLTFNIIEQEKIDLNAPIVAQNVATQIEKRSAHKRVMKRSISSSMKMGATGIKIKCSGRLAGAEIARSEVFHEGSIPLTTINANISYGAAEAHTTYGVIGVKVWIYKE